MNIKKMNDEECLQKFLKLLEDRIILNTSFVTDDSGNITHQVVEVSCGDYITYSNPEPLAVVLRPATATEQGLTVN